MKNVNRTMIMMVAFLLVFPSIHAFANGEEEQATFVDQFANFLANPIVVTVLLSVACLGLVIELFSPGFGFPGILGIMAFLLFFYGHLIEGHADYVSIIMFIIGSALIIGELFIPGGIVGVMGIAIVIISLLFAGENVVYMAYSILIAIIIAVLGMVIMMKFLGKNLHFFNKLVLRDATTTDDGYVSNENRVELLGKTGITITPLRPAGTVQVENERLDVVSQGSYINSNKKVEIIQVEGSRIVVREIIKGDE